MLKLDNQAPRVELSTLVAIARAGSQEMAQRPEIWEGLTRNLRTAWGRKLGEALVSGESSAPTLSSSEKKDLKQIRQLAGSAG